MGGDVEVITGGGEERQCTIYGAPDNSSTSSSCLHLTYMWPLSTFAQPAVLTLSTFLQRRVLTDNSAVSLQQSRLSDFRGQVAPPLDGGPPSSSFLRCDIDKISPSLFTPPFLLFLIIICTNICSDSTRLLQIGWRHFLCLISFRHT